MDDAHRYKTKQDRGTKMRENQVKGAVKVGTTV